MNDILAPILLVFLCERFQLTPAEAEGKFAKIEASLTDEQLLDVC